MIQLPFEYEVEGNKYKIVGWRGSDKLNLRIRFPSGYEMTLDWEATEDLLQSLNLTAEEIPDA